MNRVVVFWEDSFSGRKDFAPHVLALQCMVDRQRELVSRFALGKRIEAIASKGVNKLLGKIKKTEERFVIGVPDSDKLRERLGLASNTAMPDVLRELESFNPSAGFVLLEPNVERVVECACDALRIPRPTTKQRPNERDRAIFQLAAEPSAQVRLTFLEAMPSFAKVVEAIEAKLKAAEEAE